MKNRQRRLIEKILFDYYMVSSYRENEVYTPFPYYMDKGVFENMVRSSEILNNLVVKVINNAKTKHIEGKFPFENEILAVDTSLHPFFWVRYDSFQREDGGIFFAEFNYDKPCGQREILVSDMLTQKDNIDDNFRNAFVKNFKEICSKIRKQDEKLTVAILVGNTHYEEIHLAYLYMDLLVELNLDFVIAGPENFSVEDENVLVFGKSIDIILRQYPTEFLHEVGQFEEILELYKKQKVLIVNDPRAIIGQTKSLFARFWEMVEQKDSFLTDIEVKTIKETIPYTRIFDNIYIDELIKNKDKWLIKASYGRYSQEVYIGNMYTDEEWLELIEYVKKSDKPHIIQEFCKIKPENMLKFNGEFFEEVRAFGNFGVYISNDNFAGMCVRWSKNLLSSDEEVWISAVDVCESKLDIVELFADEVYRNKWREINEKAMFEYGYTGGYTGRNQSFSLQALLLEKREFNEIRQATEDISKIIKKTTKLVQDNIELIGPLLGITDNLMDLVIQQLTQYLTFVGRFDWVYDSHGQLKVLEFNSETPAGFMESIVLDKIIKEKSGCNLTNPNNNLGKLIKDCFSSIIEDYRKVSDIKNIGIVSTTYYEDWYNTSTMYNQIKDLPFNFVMGDVSALEVKDEKLYLYGTPLDAIYRYYPLQWFDEDTYFKGVIDAFKTNTLSIIPPSTQINQSKAFFALIWEMYEKGFYSKEEMKIIDKYIPITALKPKKSMNGDYCIKPYYSREGENITFSIKQIPYEKKNGNYIYQQRIDIKSILLKTYTTTSNVNKSVYPIIGAYVVGDEFGGIYTRVGDSVTDKWAVYLPTYVKD